MPVLESSFNDWHRVDVELYERQRTIRSRIAQLENQRENLPITQDRQERKKDLKHEIKQLQEEWQQLEVKKGEIAQKKDENQQAVAAIREKMIFS